ncbi:purine permease 1-like [Telopea speciosissima]|uniref:purine permease 1-like n=1 Tax=Telopea speciosissima TaxID=54955 RepID=UPI001CC38291|nr:purine permease 1-like [Telopea speciosissima]XP_043705874.1 purine permease 1-like [Telopea speciosissima]
MHVHHNKESSMMMSKTLKRSLLFLNITLLILGEAGGPLLMRLYYLHGGKRIWLSSWLETSGWPAMLVPILISYLYRRRRRRRRGGGKGDGDDGHVKFFFMKSGLFAACSFLGLLTGLVDYFYAYGISRLPVSTSALIYSTQIAFTSLFSFILVKQKLTAYSINSVVLLIIGAVVLGVHAGGDRRANETNNQYYLGFFMMVAASLLYGFVLPLIELTYKRAKQTITYSLVMEMQMVMSIFATAFCTVGMILNNDFKVIPREAREFEFKEGIYFTILAFNAIVWQCFFLGAVGVIFYGSSLLAGIIIASLLPVTELLAVVLYHEKFKVEKGISLALCLWGFTSYFYGEHKQSKKKTVELRDEPSSGMI